MRNLLFVNIMPYPALCTNPHSHTSWETVLYTFGEGKMEAGEKAFDFKEGDIICVPPGIIHTECSETGFQNIHFLFSQFHGCTEVMKVKDTVNQDIRKLLQFMLNEFHLHTEFRHLIPESLIQAVGQYVLSRQVRSSRNNEVIKLESQIISNISNYEFKLDNAMKDMTGSPDYLRKLFKKEIGMTPLEYLTAKRVEYAKTLLETKGQKYLKIQDIALMVGFSDPYYFSRVFKKATGVSPEGWK